MPDDQADSPAAAAADDDPSVETLAKLNDQELMDILGLTQTLKNAKKNIGEMQKLTGKALEYANERVARMLTPNVYLNDFNYIVEDAKRKAKVQTGDQARCDCNPCCLID